MSINERIITAVTPVVAVCEPNYYEGEEEVYCTFNVTENPVAFGDNAPHAIQYLPQLHYYLPLKQNSLATRRALCRAIRDAGFTYPSVTDASDESGQHYVFEFEDVDGDV